MLCRNCITLYDHIFHDAHCQNSLQDKLKARCLFYHRVSQSRNKLKLLILTKTSLKKGIPVLTTLRQISSNIYTQHSC